MTDLNPKGEFVTDWKPVVIAGFACRCGSFNIDYRNWESDCGGYEDTCYRCNACGQRWWVDGPDA